MAKFILEVSDEYIRKVADPKRMAESINDKTSGVDALSALFDVIASKHIRDEIDKGTTEFNLSIDDMGDDKERNLFNAAVTRCGKGEQYRSKIYALGNVNRCTGL